MTKHQANIIIGLLAVIAIFLGIQTFTPNSKPTQQTQKEGKSKMASKTPGPIEVVIVEDKSKEDIEYEYEWKEVSRDNWYFDTSENRESGRSMNYFPMIADWEYVGPLCNNGINSQYILLRRPKGK